MSPRRVRADEGPFLFPTYAVGDMGDASATLSYGRPPRRRWRRVVLATVLFIAVGAAAGGWRLRVPVQAFITDHYAAWRFARAFDRASEDLVGQGGVWLAPVADRAPDDRAEGHLRTLLATSPGGAGSYDGNDRRLVLFVRTGTTHEQRWLAFACVSTLGFEVVAFDREGRGAPGHDLAMHMPGLRQKPAASMVLRSISAHGATVRAQLEIDGGRNEILWAFDPAVAGRRPGGGASSFLVANAVMPTTGWVSSTYWWPVPQGWRLTDGPGPRREVGADGGGAAVSFLPDGRIACAGPWRVRLVDPDSDEREAHGLPLDLSPSEVFSFSPDGSRLFVGGTSQAAGLVDVLTGRVRRFAHSTSGLSRATFVDSRTLLVMDDVRRVRVDWDSLRTEPLRVDPAGSYHGFGAAGNRVAIPTAADAVVRELQSNSDVAQFEKLSGLHQLSLSPDSRWLAMKGQSGLRLFDVHSGSLLWDHDGDDDLDTAHAGVKWSADGLRGAAAGRQWVYVWSLRERRWVARFPHGLSGDSFDVALSPDGRRLAASALGSKTIAYWPDIDAAVGGKTVD